MADIYQILQIDLNVAEIAKGVMLLKYYNLI